ncbi:MAG: hypothetical protein J5586_02345 [Clostridia bacterium]|nr:hypothetical protein [Clostridia bacterium]
MRTIKTLLAVLLAAAMVLSFAACRKPGPDANGEYVIKDEKLLEGKPTEGHNRVFYEIFVGSFSDSNGDGTGDIRGIINRMDYLNDGDPASGRSLGVEGLWLTPIFESPSYHKYDVTDYYKVDPAFGTEEDLKELISICHERGVYVILDLPINHTGRKNAWFTAFREAHQKGDVGNEYYDFYSWYDANAESAPAGRKFSQILGTDHWFECNFSDDMPELDFDNDLVRQKVIEVAEHYIDMGIDGFRFDAAKYVYFGDHKSSLEFWQWYLGELRGKKPDLYVVAEVWDGDGITDIYYPAMNCFDFAISQSGGMIAETAKKGDVNKFTKYVEEYQNRVKAMREGAAITPFITNHDMDRAAGFLTTANGAMQMAANLYILGPGTPFIYYGEEIGMRGSRGGANTDANRRLAMVWGDGDTVKDPTGSTYPASNQVETAAADQMKDEASLYTYYKKLIMARKANPEIALGDYKSLNIKDSKIGGFIATYNGSSVIVIHNTTGSSAAIDLSKITDLSVSEIRAVIGMEEATLDGTTLTIGSMTSVILK